MVSAQNMIWKIKTALLINGLMDVRPENLEKVIGSLRDS